MITGRSRRNRLRVTTIQLATASCLGIVLACTSTACVQRSTVATPVTESSPKLNPFVYFEDGRVLFMAVDARAAQYVKEGTVFPLGLGLANQGRTEVSLDRESFVLETSDGTKYPLVSQEEFARDYSRSRTDARLADSFIQILRTRFRNYRYTDWPLFPFKGRLANPRSSIELGRRFWTHTYLYFPIPETGIHGEQFTLLVRVPEVGETLVLRFSIN